MIELGPDESGGTMAVSGNTLALGIGYRERYDPRKGLDAIENRSAIALIREDAPTIRTPLARGSLRRVVPISSGFVALRVVISVGPGAKMLTVAHVFFIDLDGRVTELAPLAMDASGLWVTENGEVFVHSTRAVARWSAASPGWKDVPLDPAIAGGPIRRLAQLDDGSTAVLNDDAIMGFSRLDAPPLFVRELRTYPNPIDLYGGGDRWWLVLKGESAQRVVEVTRDGAMREVANLRVVNVHNLLFSADEVFIVCAREGGSVHKNSFYVLARGGKGPMHGPYMLPDDVMTTSLWKDALVSGGAMPRVFKTSIAR